MAMSEITTDDHVRLNTDKITETGEALDELGTLVRLPELEKQVIELPVQLLRGYPKHPHFSTTTNAIALHAGRHGVRMKVVPLQNEDGLSLLVIKGEKERQQLRNDDLIEVEVIWLSDEMQIMQAISTEFLGTEISLIEKARLYQSLIQTVSGYLRRNPSVLPRHTHVYIQEKLGIPEGVLARTTRLLQLPPQVQVWVEAGRITPTVADHLLVEQRRTQMNWDSFITLAEKEVKVHGVINRSICALLIQRALATEASSAAPVQFITQRRAAEVLSRLNDIASLSATNPDQLAGIAEHILTREPNGVQRVREKIAEVVTFLTSLDSEIAQGQMAEYQFEMLPTDTVHYVNCTARQNNEVAQLHGTAVVILENTDPRYSHAKRQLKKTLRNFSYDTNHERIVLATNEPIRPFIISVHYLQDQKPLSIDEARSQLTAHPDDVRYTLTPAVRTNLNPDLAPYYGEKVIVVNKDDPRFKAAYLLLSSGSRLSFTNGENVICVVISGRHAGTCLGVKQKKYLQKIETTTTPQIPYHIQGHFTLPSSIRGIADKELWLIEKTPEHIANLPQNMQPFARMPEYVLLQMADDTTGEMYVVNKELLRSGKPPETQTAIHAVLEAQSHGISVEQSDCVEIRFDSDLPNELKHLLVSATGTIFGFKVGLTAVEKIIEPRVINEFLRKKHNNSLLYIPRFNKVFVVLSRLLT